MALPMEFWGVEVKAGQPLKVNPGNAKILHLSQASLGESKNSKGNEFVPLHVKLGDQKLVLGTLSTENFPQLSLDLVFEKEFELSHNWKSGSVYFCGYKSVVQDEYPFVTDDFSDLESDSEEEHLPMSAVENGKVVAQASAKTTAASANAGKAESSGKQKASIPQPMKVDEDDSDEDDEDDDDDDDESDEEGGDSEADSDEEEDDSDEEETPKKAEIGKKRAADSATKTPVPAKKSKLPTPQKTDGKKGGHTATPHPAKQAGKNPANSANKSQSPKSAGQVSCKSCNKTFNSEVAVQSHSKAKHGGK
ncbi:histone deacetylase HDT1-like [Syzygium oleosum]|uniref:histone deacetylase HDT1-like n=1 Tax=Syzygium oleosum TaxID=219896 RepID=UPI0024BA0A1A|nr:histone deacetylase HDT1-like [Syzygium oleosum]